MIYDWYNLFNKADFLVEGLVSRNLHVNIDGVGQKDILITKANEMSVVYGGTLLVVGFNGANPYTRDGYAVYLDAQDDVWLGLPTS